MKKSTASSPSQSQQQDPVGEDVVDSGQNAPQETTSIQETGGKSVSQLVTSTDRKRRAIFSPEEIGSKSKKDFTTSLLENSGNRPDQRQPQCAVGGVTDKAGSHVADPGEITTSTANISGLKTSASVETNSGGKKPDGTLPKTLVYENKSSNQQTEGAVDKLAQEAFITSVARQTCMENGCTEEEVNKADKRLKKRGRSSFDAKELYCEVQNMRESHEYLSD